MVLRFRHSKKSADDAIVDRVTGTFNRRQLDIVLGNGVDVGAMSTATLMIGIDDFDDLDEYGEYRSSIPSDQILERVAWVVMATVRTTDIVYRHDRSSFCVLLPATDDESSMIAAERIRANIESTPLLTDAAVTVSVGVASGSSTQIGSTVSRATQAVRGVGPNRIIAV